jgi:hypothetical protein
MTTKRFTYDAFISYAHEQQDVAIWLHRLLERYWVPGRWGRTVFLDREHLPADLLAENIERALDHSQCLIVLCSSAARESQWVDQEVDHFVSRRGTAKVFGARVGSAGDQALPRAVERHDALKGKLVPHLYGAVAQWDRQTRDERELAALALLGSILGVDKSQITARRQRVARVAGYASAVVFGLSATALTWLQASADGAFYWARAQLAADAATQRADDPALVRAAYAAGRIGDAAVVEALALSAAEPSAAGQLRLAGLAGTDAPCADVAQAYGQIDPAAIRAWPEASLLAGRRCPVDPPALAAASRLRALLDAQRFDVALPLLADEDIDVTERLQAAVLLQVVGVLPRDESSSPASMLLELLAAQHPTDRAGALADVVERLWQVRADSAEVRRLLQAAADGLLGMDAHGEAEWSALNRVAALAVLFQEADLAQRLREVAGGMDATYTPAPHCNAVGLAWAALADSGLDPTRAARRLAEAKACGSAEMPMSKSWSEWHTIAFALHAQGRWREAWALPAEVRDTRARMRLTASLMDAYTEARCRDGGLVWRPWPVRVRQCRP